MNESGRYYMYRYIHVKTEFLARPWLNSRLASWPYHAVAATISKLKLNFSPVRGSILMRFRSIEPPEFILLAIEFSSKSVAKYECNSILMQFRTAWIHSTDHCGLDR